jgi:hypothetical protein
MNLDAQQRKIADAVFESVCADLRLHGVLRTRESRPAEAALDGLTDTQRHEKGIKSFERLGLSRKVAELAARGRR